MERPTEMVSRAPGDVLMENKVVRTYFRRADFEEWGLSEGCPGCRHLRTGQGRQQVHREACRRRIEGMLKGDPHDWPRPTKESNARWLMQFERHATKNPGVRGTLKRSRISEENCAGHRAGSDITPFGLIRRIISVRCTTQRHHRY